ncbi:ABC transporter permease [Tahibacter sp. UC22_41]|uniref:ABC transporter permease n=1 Tax=Tahibacter sp. UC22_41 TaxID=3350178 RepID=UPI0036DA2AE4
MSRIDASRISGTSLLAWRNLSHDRARFVVTLVGVLFAVLLMGVELGLLLGFARTTSGLVDHTDADLWITPAGTTNVDIAGRLDERRRFEALAVSGVAQVDQLMMQFAFWRKPDGGTESVSIVGFNLATGQGRPWNLVEGTIEDLQQDDAVIIDRLYAAKLGVTALGQTVEINNRRARVVGYTAGIRTFTQSPYVFTTHRNAQRFTFFRPTRPPTCSCVCVPTPTPRPCATRCRRAWAASTSGSPKTSPARRSATG